MVPKISSTALVFAGGSAAMRCLLLRAWSKSAIQPQGEESLLARILATTFKTKLVIILSQNACRFMRPWEYNKLITVVLVCLCKDLQNK